MSNDIEKNLEKFINKTLDKAVNAGLGLVGQLIENTAKRECPVDDGILRADIKHEVVDGKHEVSIGNTVEYAPYVHEGTGIYAVSGNGRKSVPWTYRGADGQHHTTSGQKPNPYLQNSIEENRGIILKVLGEGAAESWKN